MGIPFWKNLIEALKPDIVQSVGSSSLLSSVRYMATIQSAGGGDEA